MPDSHALCADVEQAKEEMLTRFRLQKKFNKGLVFQFQMILNLQLGLLSHFGMKIKSMLKN